MHAGVDGVDSGMISNRLAMGLPLILARQRCATVWIACPFKGLAPYNARQGIVVPLMRWQAPPDLEIPKC